MNQEKKQSLTITILSLSLLTVMAGAAVAPALDVIRQHFSDESQMLIQMIISIPALFIALTNLIFPALAGRFRSKGLLLTGLLLYVAGGCCAGMFDNIYALLAMRALVGVGVGIIMPMSTGLLAFYYTRDKQDNLMGYSSAMNQMGGVIATLISGLLAGISWRASFLVYLMGLLCIILTVIFLPNEKIAGNKSDSRSKGVFREYFPFISAMFIFMFTFFIYPSSFAIESAKDGILSTGAVTVIMAGMDFIAFAGGLSYVHIKKKMGDKTRFLAPLLFTAGYALLFLFGGWAGSIIGSVFIGFANGLGIPLIISTASKKAGRTAGTTVLPLVSMALYLAQFLTPAILSAIEGVSGTIAHLPYLAAVISGILLTVWSVTVK
ncbi:MAG: MFS transporter [Emergencia sp.]